MPLSRGISESGNFTFWHEMWNLDICHGKETSSWLKHTNFRSMMAFWPLSQLKKFILPPSNEIACPLFPYWICMRSFSNSADVFNFIILRGFNPHIIIINLSLVHQEEGLHWHCKLHLALWGMPSWLDRPEGSSTFSTCSCLNLFLFNLSEIHSAFGRRP